MFISIYTSRIILDVLGVDNYGIYNVVGGFVAMFSVLSGTLTAASQRFLAFELGKKEAYIQKVFSTSVTIHLILAVCLLILIEIVGLWFLNFEMNIPVSRLYAANWVLQCSAITFCINLISIPYISVIIAYEKMSAFAYISIVEVVLKLVAVYGLYMVRYDVLIIYSIVMLLIAIFQRVIYGIYCSKRIKECSYDFSYNKEIISKMLKFSGWNLIGSSAAVFNGQGINMVVNLFFGVTMNAARGIAGQVENAAVSFVQNFMMALNPQITKSYAAGDFEYVNKMILQGTKFCFYLNWIICLPIIIDCESILHVWLKEVPEKAVVFTRLALVYTLCQSLSQCLYTTMLATGNIRNYQIVVGSLSMCAFPAAYLFFKIGFPAEYGYVSIIIFSLLCLIARLLFLKGMVPHFSISNFVTKSGLSIVANCLISCSIVLLIHQYYWNTDSLVTLFLDCFFVFIISLFVIIIIGIDKSERLFLIEQVKKRIHHGK